MPKLNTGGTKLNTKGTKLALNKPVKFTPVKFSRNPQPVENPLEDAVDLTGNLEQDIAASNEAMLAAMKNKEWQKRLHEQMQTTCDSAFWVALCFETREQKNAFWKAMNMPYNCSQQYVDGVAVAKAMGIELPGLNQFPYKAEARPDKRLNALVDMDDD